MSWRRRLATLGAAVLLAGVLLPLADPAPPRAQANAACNIGLAPADAVTGAIGLGDPASDACDAVSDPALGIVGDKVLGPLKDAAASIGKGVFNQVTAWVAEGAVWLIGEIAVLSDKTTSPNLLSKGFVRQYRLMAALAAFMAALMLIFAVFEALGRGEPGMLWRVFLINAPLAAIATSAAFVVVQLLLATSDGMCEAVTHSTGSDAHKFFEGAVKALVTIGAPSGAAAGAAAGGLAAGPAGAGLGSAAGAVAVPLFVVFIAAVIAAFAALFVWIELLMRDAAVYVVALFMPLALAASIWPRWVSALRRTCELLIVVIFSKFVIVAIISLAASLLAHNDGRVEQVFAAAAMLLLACFAPFVLFKLVPFAEGAVSAAYNRQSAASGAVRTVEFANSVQMVHRLSQANFAAASGGGGPTHSDGGGNGKAAPRPDPKGSGGGGGASAAEGAAGGAGAAGAAVPAAAIGAAKTTKSAGERLGQSDEAKIASSGAGGEGAGASQGGEQAATAAPPRPAAERPPGARPQASAAGSPEIAAEPRQASGGKAASEKPPRPSAGKGGVGS